MKHQNPAKNVTMEEARSIRDFLNAVNFSVAEMVCNPNTFGQRSIQMMPEANIPDDGEAYNLEFRFEGVMQTFPVHQVRSLLQFPDIASLKALHQSLWPNVGQHDLDGRLMRTPDIADAANRVIRELAWGPEAPSLVPVEKSSVAKSRKPAKKSPVESRSKG